MSRSDPRDEAGMKKLRRWRNLSCKDFKFTPVKEVEVEEGYKEIDRDKENRMYRRAGNLARTSLSSTGEKEKGCW